MNDVQNSKSKKTLVLCRAVLVGELPVILSSNRVYDFGAALSG